MAALQHTRHANGSQVAHEAGKGVALAEEQGSLLAQFNDGKLPPGQPAVPTRWIDGPQAGLHKFQQYCLALDIAWGIALPLLALMLTFLAVRGPSP